MWMATQDAQAEWPHGVQLHGDHMYHMGKLCVPEPLVQKLLWELHASSGHIGTKRMLQALQLKFLFPADTPLPSIVGEMRRVCTLCQASAQKHEAKEGCFEHLPIPERLMHSVCLDVFSMPPTSWDGQEYDCILLCVDRLSGWIVACPSLKLGLSAEKAAHLILHSGWEPFGVPSTVHSDMGPQFVGQWWRTLCAQLGIHLTYSQPHRPRANGRAERAGQHLLSALQKIHMEHGWNWVQALPRALKVHHDMVGPTGLSPYQVMFGRDRLVQGIPYLPHRVAEDAQEYFHRMEALDQHLSHVLQTQHDKIAQKSPHQERTGFHVGDLVWAYKPTSLSSQSKLEAKWLGPFQVVQKLGHRSYNLQDRRGTQLQVHVDQLKPYMALGEHAELAGFVGWDKILQQVLGVREGPDGEWEYLARWQDSDVDQWVPHGLRMAMGGQGKVEAYHQALQGSH